MSTSHIGVFDTTLNETNEWLGEVLAATGLPDRHYALQALRGVLHALRDEITADQSAHLSAQLPILIRGLYFEGWDPSRAPATDASASAFIDRVRPSLTGYGMPTDLHHVIRETLGVIDEHVPEVMHKIKGTLKRELRSLWN